MQDNIELYWRMYAENTMQGRHHETMRATLTTLIAAISAGALSLLKADQLSCGQLPVAVLVMALGLFGSFVSRKHFERFELHMRRASAYRREIDLLMPGLDLTGIKRTADQDHYRDFAILSRVSLSWLWSSMNLAVFLVGLAVASSIFQKESCLRTLWT